MFRSFSSGIGRFIAFAGFSTFVFLTGFLIGGSAGFSLGIETQSTWKSSQLTTHPIDQFSFIRYRVEVDKKQSWSNDTTSMLGLSAVHHSVGPMACTAERGDVCAPWICGSLESSLSVATLSWRLDYLCFGTSHLPVSEALSHLGVFRQLSKRLSARERLVPVTTNSTCPSPEQTWGQVVEVSEGEDCFVVFELPGTCLIHTLL